LVIKYFKHGVVMQIQNIIAENVNRAEIEKKAFLKASIRDKTLYLS